MRVGKGCFLFGGVGEPGGCRINPETFWDQHEPIPESSWNRIDHQEVYPVMCLLIVGCAVLYLKATLLVEADRWDRRWGEVLSCYVFVDSGDTCGVFKHFWVSKEAWGWYRWVEKRCFLFGGVGGTRRVQNQSRNVPEST